ncbi:MAG: hypothetical protein M1827_003729 [Pycnora praestabilis]|nr:MAG: hypothetical protein M1827_003729 [Pycnora praestabilis]
MSAEGLGARLLGEVKEESLAELLSSLHNLHNPHPTTQLSIPALDRLLTVFQHPSPCHQHDQQQQQQQEIWSSPQRHAPHNLPTTVPKLPKSSLSPTIEITSPTSCSGKTHLLYLITTLLTLPPGTSYGGQGGAVVVLDTDGRFDVKRLREVMRYHILSNISNDSANEKGRDIEAEIEKVTLEALTHVHIFRPQSSTSLLATVQHLPTYLLTPPTSFRSGTGSRQEQSHQSHRRVLRAVMLDSASAFYWQDLAAAEEDQATATTSKLSQTTHYRTLIKSLREIQTRFACTIIATTWGLQPNFPPHHHEYQQHQSHHSSSNSPPSFRPHLPPVWTSFMTLRLIVQRTKTPRFGPGVSIQEVGISPAPAPASVPAPVPESSVRQQDQGAGQEQREHRIGANGFAWRAMLGVDAAPSPPVVIATTNPAPAPLPHQLPAAAATGSGDALNRHTVVSAGRFQGWINTYDRDEWTPGVWEGLRDREGGMKGSFGFWVRREGCGME